MIKELDDTENWYESKYIYPLYKLYRKLIGRPLERLEHHYSYLKVLNNDYDWESHSIYDFLDHKLQRLEVALDNGLGHHDTPTIKSLNLALKLVDRLKEEDYRDNFKRHEKKWGELITWTEPTDNPHATLWCSRRPNANTDEEKAQESQEFLLAARADEAKKNRDRKLFFSILAKYQPYWWD